MKLAGNMQQGFILKNSAGRYPDLKSHYIVEPIPKAVTWINRLIRQTLC